MELYNKDPNAKIAITPDKIFARGSLLVTQDSDLMVLTSHERAVKFANDIIKQADLLWETNPYPVDTSIRTKDYKNMIERGE